MYTPHTVTLYNVRITTDLTTMEDVVDTNITILRGVFFDNAKASNINRSGSTNADAVNLSVPFCVDAIDGIGGHSKRYVTPKEYERLSNHEDVFTFDTGSNCFFVKGEVVEESFLSGKDVQVINNGINLNTFKPTESNFRKEYIKAFLN